MNVAVVGCGYVGVVTATGLAARGHHVVGIEGWEARRASLEQGVPPFHEPGLEELLRSGSDSGRLRFAADAAAAGEADVVFVAVQTPSDADGAIDLTFLREACEQVARVFAGTPRRRVVAVRSTVVPGTTDELVAPIVATEYTATAANPEFLREGSAVSDFLVPDRIVVGTTMPWAADMLGMLYAPFEAPIVHTTPATAELAKYASNSLLATLISYSNEIARAAEALGGVDVEDVFEILYRDRRLTPIVDGEPVRPEILTFLKAGCGYGGSCLPKDVAALVAADARRGIGHPLLEAVQRVNDRQALRVVELAEDAIGDLAGRRIAVLGLAFKGGTDDIRSSPGLRVIDELLACGALVSAFDPLVPVEAIDRYGSRVKARATLDEAVAGAEACIVTTNAPEFARLYELAGTNGPAIVDGRRFLDPDRFPAASFRAVGRGVTR